MKKGHPYGCEKGSEMGGVPSICYSWQLEAVMGQRGCELLWPEGSAGEKHWSSWERRPTEERTEKWRGRSGGNH